MRDKDTIQDADQTTLVVRAQAGDESAFAELMRIYLPPVVRYIAVILRDQAVAEDVAQDAFLRAFRNIGRLRDPERFRHWLFKIARYAALDHRKREEKWGLTAQETIPPEDVDDAVFRTEVDGFCRYHTLLDLVRDAVDELSEDTIALVRYRYAEALSYEEIAQLVGMSVVQTKGRLARAREKLRVRLAGAVKEWRRIRNEMP